MKRHDIGKYTREHEGKYLVVNALARRVRALQSGHKPLIKHAGGNLADVALQEFAQDHVIVSTLAEASDEDEENGLEAREAESAKDEAK